MGPKMRPMMNMPTSKKPRTELRSACSMPRKKGKLKPKAIMMSEVTTKIGLRPYLSDSMEETGMPMMNMKMEISWISRNSR